MHPTPRDSAAYTLPPLRMTLSLHTRQPCPHGPSPHQPASSSPPATPLYKSIKAAPCRRTPPRFSDLGLEKKTVRKGGETAGAMSCHHLFTASQLQELEVQALMFNCFSLGLPIPSHLLVSFGRSTRKRGSEGFFPRHPPLGWGCFKLGSKGKAEDLEPGRCRRTDGKKWRCSRGACPGSKYCVRHLHRGKNRLRKTAEISPQKPPLFLLPPETRDFEQHRYSNPIEEKETEQPSSSGTSGLSFQNETKVSFNSRAMEEEQKEQKLEGIENAKFLHCFFDERPEEGARGSICKTQLSISGEGDEDFSGSASRRNRTPLPALLDLNV